MAATINYNDDHFRVLFPPYANPSTYPQAFVQNYWDMAICYISNKNGGCFAGGLSIGQQTLACNLMTAHLVYLSGLIGAGQTPGIETGATIDKISVTLEPPPLANMWQYWLASSPYGTQLLALLQALSAGGFYVTSGLPGRAGFRNGLCW